jgi:hypothetical protein
MGLCKQNTTQSDGAVTGLARSDPFTLPYLRRSSPVLPATEDGLYESPVNQCEHHAFFVSCTRPPHDWLVQARLRS